jgi:hypothetical protein
MGLDPSDLKWLDETLDRKLGNVTSDFGERLKTMGDGLGTRIERHRDALVHQIESVRSEVSVANKESQTRIEAIAEQLHQHSTSCPTMQKHLDEKHNIAKSIGIVSAISATAVAVFKLIGYVIGKGLMP